MPGFAAGDFVVSIFRVSQIPSVWTIKGRDLRKFWRERNRDQDSLLG